MNFKGASNAIYACSDEVRRLVGVQNSATSAFLPELVRCFLEGVAASVSGDSARMSGADPTLISCGPVLLMLLLRRHRRIGVDNISVGPAEALLQLCRAVGNTRPHAAAAARRPRELLMSSPQAPLPPRGVVDLGDAPPPALLLRRRRERAAAALGVPSRLLRDDRGVPSRLFRGTEGTPGKDDRLRGLRGVTTVESGFSTIKRCQWPKSSHRATTSSLQSLSLSFGARTLDVARLCKKNALRCRTSEDPST